MTDNNDESLFERGINQNNNFEMGGGQQAVNGNNNIQNQWINNNTNVVYYILPKDQNIINITFEEVKKEFPKKIYFKYSEPELEENYIEIYQKNRPIRIKIKEMNDCSKIRLEKRVKLFNIIFPILIFLTLIIAILFYIIKKVIILDLRLMIILLGLSFFITDRLGKNFKESKKYYRLRKEIAQYLLFEAERINNN